MNAQELVHDVAAALQLRESEERLRTAGRSLELVPSRRDEANRLFDLASRVRAERLEILERCGLSS